ncbi:CheR family methyltransferase [Microvirga arabica]
MIIAVGASGANSQPVERFLSELSLDKSMAVILTFQHREALDEERLRQHLTRQRLELSLASDGVLLEAGKIYCPSPNTVLTLADGHFRSRVAQEAPGERGTIDSFFVSVAGDQDKNIVGIIFSGAGGDGILGFAAIKEAGGLTLAEETDEVSSENLAVSSSPVALADFVLPVEQMSERIRLYAQRLKNYRTTAGEDHAAEEISGALASVASILRNKTGHDFHGYKAGTFLRRVQRRMQVVQADTVEAYLDVLRTQADEAQNLFNDLLIGVTHFFRDRREFELLETQVIPKLFEGKTRNDSVRVWVLGCSTGEEAYSIGILLREHMAKLDTMPHVQIFASDIDGRALATARVGRYTEAITKDVSPERLARWFVKEGNTYCVVKELREMCIFSQHSVVKDAPFSRLDLISCRNLLIYLNADLQDRVIPLFHFALKPGGFLFLGNSENISRHTRLFTPVDRAFRIYQRLETTVRVMPDFPFTAVDRRPPENVLPPRPRAVEGNLVRQAETIAERYAPAHVVIDDNFDVLHFSGRSGRYIEPAGGAASLNLLNLVHPDLRLDLRVALTKAGEERQTVQIEGLSMGTNGKRRMVDIVVEPLGEQPNARSGYVVILKDGMAPAEEHMDGTIGTVRHDEHVQRLEAELRVTRERLQATIEELESTNEELKSSNEEYQSLNEELQSANEELETSKEEVQSVNEELTTVNGELAHRVQELGRTNSDLKNLLESTQIATVFLDNELRVMNYTPAVAEIFHLVETDIGRPIAHIKARISYDELQEDARRVARTLGSVDREIADPSTGTRYMVRVLPYRSVDNFIGGIVVTFTDMTPLMKAQQALRESEERFRAIITQATIGIAETRDGSLTYVNDRFCAMAGRGSEALMGKSLGEILHPEDAERNAALLKRLYATGEPFTADTRYVRPDGSVVWALTSVSPIRDAGGRIAGGSVACIDISDRKQAEGALHESERHTKLLLAELQHRVRNTLAVVRSITRRTAETSETVEDYAMHLEGRIDAFARAQAMATRAPDAGVDLEEFLREELLSLTVRDEEKARIDGPPVRLRAKTADSIGLAIHELATNALKYGALSGAGGHIDVTWRIGGTDGDRRLKLEWRESGVSVAGVAPRRRGFGSELIESTLRYELDAETELQFTPGGIRCTIEIPISDQNAATGVPHRQGQSDREAIDDEHNQQRKG